MTWPRCGSASQSWFIGSLRKPKCIMTRDMRDRVTIDLRGIGARLQARAAARGMSAAALMRAAVVPLLEDGPSVSDADNADCDHVESAGGGRGAKVTLRLSAAHAIALAARARAPDVSQGNYVSGLIDGTPPHPLPPDHADAVAALIRSTDQLAVVSADLNSHMRLFGKCRLAEIERLGAVVMSLADDVRRHLSEVAPLVAELRSTKRPHGNDQRAVPRVERRPR